MTAPPETSARPDPRGIAKVIAAASAGTVIEWYDFYIFGSLATVLARHFFPEGDPTASFLKTLGLFATGFVVRPFGAVVFGRIGDRIGRKYAFLLTLVLMGAGTALIGVVPGYSRIGIAAPILLLVLRLLQGLALGGEYGGAAVYVAEHAPDGRRGFYTSFIQITATAGLFVSLGVILATQAFLGDETFERWGWRVPFLLSLLLVGVSIYIRMRLRESPLFARLKASGRASSAPVRDSLGSGRNWKLMLLALFGATAGQGVVWYTGQFSALYFLDKNLGVGLLAAQRIVCVALVLGVPFFVVFGALSDRIGRKRVMLAGNLLAVLTWIPIYRAMERFADPVNEWMLILLVFVQVVWVTMVYGPIAAFLVELFPARIRYTSLSLPYHLGNGVFGGLTPLIGQWLAARADSAIAGLAWPMAIASITVVVGAIALPETKDVRIWDEVEPGAAPPA